MEPSTKANFSFADLDGTALGQPEVVGELLQMDIREGVRSTDPDAVLPGRGVQDLRHKLTDDQLQTLARDLCNTVDRCKDMMSERWEREDFIEDSYALQVNTQRTGSYEGASQLCSGMLMASVDQAHARVSRTILDVTPRMKVDAIQTEVMPNDEAELLARATETFLENYSRRTVKIDRQLSMAILRLCKVGTAVVQLDWEDTEQKFFVYDKDGKRRERTKKKGGLRWNLIRNQDTILWPPWEQDWQRAEVMGHVEILTRSEWRQMVIDNGIDRTIAKEVERYGRSEGLTENRKRELSRADIDPEAEATDRGLIRIANLWCNMPISGDEDGDYEPIRFQAILHLGLRKIVWINYNQLNSQKHPYYPIRYKKVDGSGWGTGIGHEVFFCQMADEAFLNLGMDNLLSTAHSVFLLKSGSMADQLLDRIYPGMRIPTEDPSGDMEVKSLAANGPIDMIYQAQQDNEMRKMSYSGLAAVLSGMGDPTMKSGAGTGAVLALVEQAGKKFGMIDANIREDVSEVYIGSLEFVAQFAPEGAFYENAPDEQAHRVEMLKYLPPQGDLEALLRISVRAPSAANNKEIQKQSVLVAYQFLMQHAQMLLQTAVPLLQQENPAAVGRYQRELLDFVGMVANRVLELSEVPDVQGGMPSLPEATEEDQQINELTQQLQQAQQQIASLTQQVQQMTGQGAGDATGGQPTGATTPQGYPGSPLDSGASGLPSAGDQGAPQ